jgi:hypothetical protein
MKFLKIVNHYKNKKHCVVYISIPGIFITQLHVHIITQYDE